MFTPITRVDLAPFMRDVSLPQKVTCLSKAEALNSYLIAANFYSGRESTPRHTIYADAVSKRPVVNANVRDTFDLCFAYTPEQLAGLLTVMQQHASLAAGVTLVPSVALQVLGYSKNSKFISHADSHVWLRGGWVHTAPERKFTSILSLSEPGAGKVNSFSGGELLFNNFYDGSRVATFQLAAGELITFPSDPLFQHEVLPVTYGLRIVLVMFWNTAG